MLSHKNASVGTKIQAFSVCRKANGGREKRIKAVNCSGKEAVKSAVKIQLNLSRTAL